MPDPPENGKGPPMANVLADEKRLEVLAVLVNGGSVRAAERQTGAHHDTIVRFGVAVGEGCARLHDRLVRDLTSPLVDLDEQHSWCSKRQVNVDRVNDPPEVGEQWIWASICRTTQLMVAWHVGKRDGASAEIVVADTRSRLTVMPQIATDGLALYEAPIAKHFGYAVPYVQTIKRFARGGGRPGFAEKFSHAKGVDFIEKRVVFGAPDLDLASTYAIERSNLTNRQWNARLHRRTLAFSKRLTSHRASVALQYVYQNLCHVPRNMRVTPAMAAGVTDKVWSLGELMVAALGEVPGEKPSAKPLFIPKPEAPARELPGGRGWLQIVKSGGAPAGGPAPVTPPAAPVAPMPAAATSGLVTDATGQLDLFSWTAPKREQVQLDLFAWEPTRRE